MNAGKGSLSLGPLGLALAVGLVSYGAVQAVVTLGKALDAFATLKLAPGQDPSSQALRRYEPLRSHLPKLGVVGYWCEATGQTGVLDPKVNQAIGGRWIDAQLALAPLVLVTSLEPRYVVADFVGLVPPPPPGTNLVEKLRVEPGLALFENPDKGPR